MNCGPDVIYMRIPVGCCASWMPPKGNTMPRIIIELTNRCNLRCQHCFAERHAATGDLPLAMLEQVLQEGKDCGIHIWHLPVGSLRSTASSQRSSHVCAQRTMIGVWSVMASTFRRSTPSCCALGPGSRA